MHGRSKQLRGREEKHHLIKERDDGTFLRAKQAVSQKEPSSALSAPKEKL